MKPHNSSPLPKILEQLLKFCLYAVLFTPLLICSKFLFPFITPKVIYFRCLVEIALFFYILLLFYKPNYRVRFTPLISAIFVYIFVMTFASIFGVNPYKSFWGNIERGEGLLTIYHLAIFFILLTCVFRTKKDWIRFFNISVFVSFLLSLYALFQKFGFKWTVHPGQARLMSTLGNPSYVGAYLLIHIFLILFLINTRRSTEMEPPSADTQIHTDKNYLRKLSLIHFYYIAVFFLEVYVLFNTRTRGAILGLFFGALVWAFLNVVFSKQRKVKSVFAVLLLLLFFSALGVWTFRNAQWIRAIPGIGRIASISLNDITAQNRLMSWHSGIEGWKDRPILGYGYENFNIAFNKYFNPKMYRDPGSRVWFDRAHNVLIDQLVYGGVFGILSYLAIFGVAILFLLRRMKSKREEYTILFSLLAGYLFQNLFVFDCLAVYISICFVLAFINSQMREFEIKKSASDAAKEGFSKSPSIFMIIILILALLFSVHFFNIRLAWNNHFCAKGLAYASAENYRKSIEEFEKALSCVCNQSPEIRQHLANTVMSGIRSDKLTKEEKKSACDYAISEMKKNIEFAQSDCFYYLYLMSLYNSCSVFNRERLELTLETGERALKLCPNRVQFYFQMGQAAINLGRNKQGIDYFKKAVELNPQVIESHWNLASAYIVTYNEDLAQKEFDKMKKMGFKYNTVKNLERLIRPYYIVKDYRKLKEIYLKLIELKPNNAKYYAGLAAVYKNLGEKEKAKQMVKKAMELDPSYKEEAEIFLQMLEGGKQ
ncbi:O-antigen ligase family protein [bacterium]|nr:O-antigen ligase family protein [bacterium]